jgi:ribokinase
MPAQVTVFGSINIDLIAEVARLPLPGETVAGRALRTLPGGKGANQALAAARAGARVRLVGAVGTDAFAGPALAGCRAAGVDLAGVATVDGPTGTALILVADGGENVIAVIPGANGATRADEAAALAFDPGEVLLVQLETPIAAVIAAAGAARAARAKVILNPAPFEAGVAEHLGRVDVLIVNRGECDGLARAGGLAAGPIEATVAALAARFGLAVVATLGPDGAIAAAAAGGRLLRAPALAVEAIDTVGAGDTFCGYLAAELAAGGALDADTLAIAAAAASLACTVRGAQPSIPERAAVLAAMAAG